MSQQLSIALLLTSLTSLALFFFYSAYSAYSLAYKICHPDKRRAPLKLKEGIEVEKFDFITEDGVPLKGVVVTPPGKIRGTIMVCHNLGGSKESSLSSMRFLLDEGFRLLGFDLRNHGESGLVRGLTFAYTTDFEAFYKKCEQLGVFKGRLGVIGLSVGSNVALHGICSFTRIEALTIDSGPLIYCRDYFNYILDSEKIVNPIMRAFFNFFYLSYAGFNRLERSSRAILERLKGRDIFIIEAEKDHIIPVHNSRKAYELSGSERAQLWTVANSRHLTNYVVAREEYRKRVAGFFKAALLEKKEMTGL